MSATKITTAVDALGHTYLIDGDRVTISIYGAQTTVSREEAQVWWATSAKVARSRLLPVDIEAGRRSLHGR